MRTFSGSGRTIPFFASATVIVLILSFLPTILFLLFHPPSAFASGSLVHHDLKIVLSPNEHRLSVVDSISLPDDFPREFVFSLHGGLNPSSPTLHVEIVKQGDRQEAVLLETYKVKLPKDLRAFTVVYEGEIYHPLDQESAVQAGGVQDTPGIIDRDGAVLSGNSGWHPDLGPRFMTFDLEVKLPPSWDAVSQGSRVHVAQGSASTLARWNSSEPQGSIFLIAAPFTHYARTAGPFIAMAFLRTPDEAMADTYLDATVRYVDMYSQLIGPYPYTKFALVENFWETGFGMPSFTLLGSRVIRLPFIINSSYPHEILHNWWGNSVFPEYEKGNWSEGLTAYLSDHLIKEQQNAGAEYRMNTLQKYADYVTGNRDFPLTQFRSRHSSSSEAIGYGKALMFFHLLRQELGDEVFARGLREFYKRFRFRTADWTDIRASLEDVSGKDLQHEFEQGVVRGGAPQLQVSSAKVEKRGDRYAVTAVMKQVQPGEAYRLRVPVAVTMEGQDQAFQAVIALNDKEAKIDLAVSARPLRLDIDPEFDLFRRLDQDEIPPAISQALGAKKMLIILPSQSNGKLREAYQGLAQAIGGAGPNEVEVKLDTQVKKLPDDRSIAVIGWENRFVGEITSALSEYGVSVTPESVGIGRTAMPKQNHSFVLSARVPGRKETALLFLASDKAEALPGLGRKLPHYHKYSYLVFEGQEPVNVAKGRWPVVHSPLTVVFPREDGTLSPTETGKLVPRKALASMPEAEIRKKNGKNLHGGGENK